MSEELDTSQTGPTPKERRKRFRRGEATLTPEARARSAASAGSSRGVVTLVLLALVIVPGYLSSRSAVHEALPEVPAAVPCVGDLGALFGALRAVPREARLRPPDRLPGLHARSVLRVARGAVDSPEGDRFAAHQRRVPELPSRLPHRLSLRRPQHPASRARRRAQAQVHRSATATSSTTRTPRATTSRGWRPASSATTASRPRTRA